MNKFLKRLALGIFLALPWIGAASAQQVNLYCLIDTGPPLHWGPCSSTNKLAVSATITPSGTQDINITQILGAAPSLTNPLWVFPATGATFPVSGTVTVTEPSTANTASSALAANLVINTAASSLYSFNVSADSTLSAAAWWIMVYNATSAPADGAVTPARCYALASGTTSFSAAFPVGLPFSTGITMGVSTTGCFTKTASTHAFIAGDFK